MTVNILDDIKINPGAPSPKVISSDTELYLIFYSGKGSDSINVSKGRDNLSDAGVGIVRFEHNLIYKFGLPGDETLSGHPYNLELNYYSGQFIENSPWLEELNKIDSIHPYHTPFSSDDFKHYVFTFHDNTFECIARGYEAVYKPKTMFDAANDVLGSVFASEL